MRTLFTYLAPALLLFLAITLVEAGVTANHAEARSMKGGRSFSMPMRTAPSTGTYGSSRSSGGFRRGLAGGLLGGALGGLLFGSMFGGQGMGLLPLLLIGGAVYYLYRQSQGGRRGGARNRGPFGSPGGMAGYGGPADSGGPPPVPPEPVGNPVVEGLAQIRSHDRAFNDAYFLEVASDVFFQVQAGWMRRDLDSYRHLLGDELAGEYAEHFARMRREGRINKLESIAIRNVEIVQAGSDGREDFVTVLFTANLLDYTVDDRSGELVEGSMTQPVKFREEWTWARPTGTQDWKLEGIK